MKKIIFFAILATFMMSCSGDDTADETIIPVNKEVLLKHYTFEDINGLHNYDIEYEGKRMIKITRDNNQFQQFGYLDDVLTNIIHHGYRDTTRDYMIEYDQNGRINKYTTIFRGQETSTDEISYPSENTFTAPTNINGTHNIGTYTIQNGNIIKKETPGRRTEYEYDNKNAPKKNIEFANVFLHFLLSNDYNQYGYNEYGNNNCTKETTYLNGVISNQDSYEYKYTYDANNFPLTKKCFYNGDRLMYTITYSYE